MDQVLRPIAVAYGRVLEKLGDVLDTPSLILPNTKFFPDTFKGDAEGIATFFERMRSYTPLPDNLPVALRFIESEGESEKACNSGGCSAPKLAGRYLRIDREGDGYVVDLHVADASNPTVLAAALARSTGGLLLLEGGVDLSPSEFGALSEVAAIASGLGLLVLEGASVMTKACSGVREHRATFLSTEEAAVGLGIFSELHNLSLGSSKGRLGATQAEAVEYAFSWVRANHEILDHLENKPELIATDLFRVSPPSGAIGRFFRAFAKRRESPSATQPVIILPKKPVDERVADLRADVEDALREA